MKKHYLGIDVLRGLGIFCVISLHTAFYFYSGIFEIDFDNPPLIITLIGFFLMFAGLFAMISGLGHTIQAFRKIEEKGYSFKDVLKYSLVATLYILLIAYFYFLVTGPGLIKFDSNTFDNSLLVELIKSGRFILPSMERVLYIDSLIMIGMNIILLSLITVVGFKYIKLLKNKSIYYYLVALIVLGISALRVPLYDVYIEAVDNGNHFLVIMLNWVVNKNNPILPFLTFALFGAWISTLLINGDKKVLKRYVLISGATFFIVGIFLYVNTEDTMLERSIDYKWYSIMIAQIGLFKLIIYAFLKVYDLNDKDTKLNVFSRFLYRFGIAGLTVFFIEQIFSSLFLELMKLFNTDLYLGITASIIIGLVLAVIWGLLLKVWSKYNYKYGLEYFYTKLMAKYGGSAKEDKLNK